MKTTISVIMATGLMWLLSIRCAAQMIEGRVYAEEYGKVEPLPYANVFWKSDKSGTVTNQDGIFRIRRPKKPDTLVVSFVGFKRVELLIEDRVRSLDSIVLSPGHLLEEVEIREVVKGIEISHKSISLTQTIGKKELLKAACCNLSESFETNPAVESSFTDAISGMRQVELQGLSGKYSLLQIENILVGRGMYQNLAWASIPGPWIESIQLTKGIGSVVNGFESMSGHIHLELLKPESAPVLEANAYVNNALRHEINIMHSSLVNDYVSFGTLMHFNNSPVPWDMNGDNFMDMPIGRQFHIQNKWKYSNGLNFEGQAGIRLLNDERAGGSLDTRLDGQLTQPLWAFRSTDRRWEFFTKNAWIFDGDIPKSIGLITSIHQHGSSRTYGQRLFLGNQSSVYQNLIFQIGGEQLSWTVKTGASVQYDDLSGSIGTQDFVHEFREQRSESVTGIFAEAHWRYRDVVSVLIGSRLDYSSLFGFFVTPRIHMRYMPAEKTTIRLHAGTGRRTPLLALESTPALFSNRELYVTSQIEQEKSFNAGVSIQQDFRLNYRKGSLVADVQRIYFTNQFVADFDLHALEYHGYFARGSSADQVMVQVDYEIWKRLEARMAYKRQWVFTEFVHQRLETPYVSPERWFLNLQYSTRTRWKYDLTVNHYLSKRLPQTSEKGETFRVSDRSPDFWIVNGQINYILKRGEIYLGVENLFNLRQNNPVIAAHQPMHPSFDATLVWGPIFGRMVYMGINYPLI
ncbi:MAG: TonB-dependent receptor [Thermaurantimonas sp.]